MPSSARSQIVDRYRAHPGRGGCGVGAVVDLKGPTHDVVAQALAGLGCMEHRGGVIDDTGDGAGVLLTLDEAFFARFITPGKRLPPGDRLSVGVVFFPLGEDANLPAWRHDIDAVLRRAGLEPLGWRRVPTNEEALGHKARAA